MDQSFKELEAMFGKPSKAEKMGGAGKKSMYIGTFVSF
jgi:hypothetical protein